MNSHDKPTQEPSATEKENPDYIESAVLGGKSQHNRVNQGPENIDNVRSNSGGEPCESPTIFGFTLPFFACAEVAYPYSYSSIKHHIKEAKEDLMNNGKCGYFKTLLNYYPKESIAIIESITEEDFNVLKQNEKHPHWEYIGVTGNSDQQDDSRHINFELDRGLVQVAELMPAPGSYYACLNNINEMRQKFGFAPLFSTDIPPNLLVSELEAETPVMNSKHINVDSRLNVDIRLDEPLKKESLPLQGTINTHSISVTQDCSLSSRAKDLKTSVSNSHADIKTEEAKNAHPPGHGTNHCTFLQPLSFNDVLSGIQYCVGYLNQFFPWNKQQKLSVTVRACLEKQAKELTKLEKQFNDKKQSRSYHVGVHHDLFKDTDHAISQAKLLIRNALKSGSISSSAASSIDKYISQIKDWLPKLVDNKKAHKVRQDIRRVKTLEKRHADKPKANQYLNGMSLFSNNSISMPLAGYRQGTAIASKSFVPRQLGS